MNVLTVCSGIGAPETAWKDLGFNFIGQSEIEPFPSAVLKHHFPEVPNFGDMTKFKEWDIDQDVNILCGGTPCTSFSIAGRREGLASKTGNLTLTFVEMAEHYMPEWLVWENVPNALTTNGGSDFATYIGALSDIGYSFAWRVLDSKNFGVSQRRRRLFLIAHLDERYAREVLFESEGLCRDSEESRAQGEGNPTRIKEGSGASTIYEHNQTDARLKPTKVCPTILARWGTGGNNTPLVINRMRGFGDYCESDHASALKARDYKDATDLIINEQSIVRRIHPVEAERLMGFEDGHTDIQFNGKKASDANRYKSIGNSMAVPVLRWIGERILKTERQFADD